MKDETPTRETVERDPPNVLFLVWDACRLDDARAEATTLRELGEGNLWFENAVAPSTWSLPSHASLFTGEYPHEHGIRRATDSMDSVTLFDELHEKGYSLYGVSGNGFASHSTNLHQFFDDFTYTAGQGPYLDGLTVYAHVFGQRERDDSLSPVRATADTVRAVSTHEHPLKSLVNFSAVGLNRLAANVPPLQRLPYRIFDPYQPYSYRPERNSRKIREFLRQEADSNEPFFVFANYMDTHRPYHPPEERREEYLGETLSFGELSRLNQTVEDPWQFLTKAANDDLDDDEIETIRDLYRGEVASVDEHLDRILEELDRQDLREDTLIVVTADHGENLGEVDAMGRRRMGHESSVSDDLLRVPLVVAHPDLDGRNVTEFANLKDLYDLLLSDWNELLESAGRNLGSIASKPYVVAEYPAVGGEELYDRYSDVPRDVLEHRVEEHAAIVYADEWRLVAESTGDAWAWHDSDPVPFEDAPDRLAERCLEHLDRLHVDEDDDSLRAQDVEQLEALGYI